MESGPFPKWAFRLVVPRSSWPCVQACATAARVGDGHRPNGNIVGHFVELHAPALSHSCSCAEAMHGASLSKRGCRLNGKPI
eukprot:6218298-Pyramimonas_sp.AAC.1